MSTPDRRKTKRLCHINMLKQYFERQDKAQLFKGIVKMQTMVKVQQKKIRWKERKKKTKSLKEI